MTSANAKPITICGVRYPSKQAAAESAGISRSTLNIRIRLGLPEDQWLRPKAGPLPPKPVECIETGQVYRSVSEAAKAVYTSSTNLSSCLTGHQRTAAGYHWRYAEGV